MLAVATLLLALQADPALDAAHEVTELQLAGRPREALRRAERELAERPREARRLGMDYLRGHLLELLGDHRAAALAFAEVLTHTPDLEHYSRYRLALDQERMGHPEVAAGLVAKAVGAQPGSPLLPDAVRLLMRALGRGGDCRVLGGIDIDRLADAEGRRVALAQADCAYRDGQRELARSLYYALVQDEARDETAREAAERLAALVPASQGGRPALRLGLVYHQHREWDPALRWLQAALGGGGGLSTGQRLEALYAVGRAQFFQENHARAAATFGELAQRAAAPEERARAMYQQARAHELLGQWPTATTLFRLAYRASPSGEWSGASLLSALRLHWRSGREQPALELYGLLSSRRDWRQHAARAALFLAASDLARGRHDRADGWLGQVAAAAQHDPIELAYWRGRREELAGDAAGAVCAYAGGARLDPYSPFAQAALGRVRAPELAAAAAAEARRLAASRSPADLHAAMLVAPGSPSARAASQSLIRRLASDPDTRPYLVLAQVPGASWPLWGETLDRPEEKLLALGLWREGAPAAVEHFPATAPSLAFTASVILARAGEIRRSMAFAEEVRLRTPPRVPLAVQPTAFRNLLYPLPHREYVATEARRHGVDPHLLAAILREESRFEARALSGSAARGLAQMTAQTAQRVAAAAGLGRVTPDDLYRPEVSIALGAAHLAELAREAPGGEHLIVAAYNAGAPPARLWRSYCFGPDPMEYLTKVAFEETRDYLRKVLTSREHYERLYP